MPELPEVETIRRELEPLLTGRRFTGVEVSRPDIIGWPKPAGFVAGAVGRQINGTGRRGKYLVLALDRGYEVIIHLRLSGRLEVLPSRRAALRFERIRFRLTGGRALALVEPRALGRVYLVEAGNYPPVLRGMTAMGPEPTSREFGAAFLAARLAGRRTAIKNLLLDQKVCCGVGNIYSDEALYRAGVRPTRPAGDLSPAEVGRLAASLRKVIREGIRWCGTTLDDGRYQRPGTEHGGFQHRLGVYGREGEACRGPGCRRTILRVKLGNRSSCYCPVCQK